jgi:hypothetical protein
MFPTAEVLAVEYEPTVGLDKPPLIVKLYSVSQTHNVGAEIVNKFEPLSVNQSAARVFGGGTNEHGLVSVTPPGRTRIFAASFTKPVAELVH